MIDMKKMQNSDPIKRMVEKQSEQEEFSPMDPPDAPPGLEPVPYEKMPLFLQKLIDEHKASLQKIEIFEEALLKLQQNGLVPDPKVDGELRQFFTFLDENIVRHNLKEEKILFPVLQKRLLEKGEHSKGDYHKTAVDMLEDDHVKLMQNAAVTFNLLGLAARLPDMTSRIMVLDAALEQGKSLVELLRLHIFREDNVVFSLAVKYFTKEEFLKMDKQLPRYEHY